MEPFWIETNNALRLAIVPRPRGGDWLEDDVRAMKRAGVDVVVSMLTPEEVTELGLAREASALPKQVSHSNLLPYRIGRFLLRPGLSQLS